MGAGQFVDALTRFAHRTGDPRLTPIIERVAAPLRVVVTGRDGVGRGTVAAALAGCGLTVVDGAASDVVVHVIVEAVKPEDRRAADEPALMVLNKADLAGFGPGGPVAIAQRRAAQCQTTTGVPTVAMIGLLAGVVLDDELVSALRVLVAEPADLRSVDAFVAAEHRLPRPVRERLLATLDRFGIAHAVLALSQGSDAATLPDLLRRLSNVESVVARVEAAAAPLRYRRVQAAVRELNCFAADSEFLRGDELVLAVMSAAVDVLEAAGLPVDRGDDPGSHLRRAVHWRRYRRGPVGAVHRSCAADVTRGSLRLLRQSR